MHLSGVRLSVCPSVRLSVHLSVPAWAHSSKHTEVIAVAPRAGDIDRLLHGRRSAAAAP